MYSHTVALALSVLFSASSPTLAVPDEPFSAQVIEVYHGDSLKLDSSHGPLLVSLYGVRGDPTDLTKIEAAHEFIASATLDATLEVRPMRVISGLSYVEAVLPSGEVLNKLLLEKGLAQLDELSAGNDETYEQIALRADKSATNEHTDPAPALSRTAEPEDPGKALSQFKIRKQLKEIAQFEAEVEKWRALPEGYRTTLAASYGYTLRSGSTRLSQETARRQQSVEGTVQRLWDNQARIAAHEQAIGHVNMRELAALADVYDDFDLQWDQGLYDTRYKDYLAELATGKRYSAGISAGLLNEYAARIMIDQARVDSNAAAVAAEHENVRAAHRAEMAAIQAQHTAIVRMIRHAEAEARAAATMKAKHEKHFADALQRIQILDVAVTDEFQPSLVPIVTERFTGNQSERFAKFTVDTIVWRIDWYVKKQADTASFSIDLYEAEDDKFLEHHRKSSIRNVCHL